MSLTEESQLEHPFNPLQSRPPLIPHSAKQPNSHNDRESTSSLPCVYARDDDPQCVKIRNPADRENLKKKKKRKEKEQSAAAQQRIAGIIQADKE